MSGWDGYIAQMCAKGPNGETILEQSAVCGHESGQQSIWGSTVDFKITADEISKMAKWDISSFQANGLYINGQKCRFLRVWEDDKYGKVIDLKTAADSSNKSYNVCVIKTNKALVIGKGADGVSGGTVDDKVCFTAGYLKGLGY